jgi:uncharacterized protein with GYD domain
MPRYVTLINWTEHGIAGFRESVDRSEASEQQFEELGVRFIDVYWTLGEHDSVVIAEAPDDESVTAALLMLGSAGNVRTKTMRAFSRDEMRGIIGKTS